MSVAASSTISIRLLTDILHYERLAQYLEEEPLRKKAQLEANKAKLEALERSLGLSKDPSAAGPSGSGSDAPATLAKGKEPERLAGTKHRFEDTEFLQESETIVENVKSAVALGMRVSTLSVLPITERLYLASYC